MVQCDEGWTINWLCKIRRGKWWTFDKHARHWYLEWHYMYEHVEWGCFTKDYWFHGSGTCQFKKKKLLLAWP
jgi:hypothetical protein